MRHSGSLGLLLFLPQNDFSVSPRQDGFPAPSKPQSVRWLPVGHSWFSTSERRGLKLSRDSRNVPKQEGVGYSRDSRAPYKRAGTKREKKRENDLGYLHHKNPPSWNNKPRLTRPRMALVARSVCRLGSHTRRVRVFSIAASNVMHGLPWGKVSGAPSGLMFPALRNTSPNASQTAR